jgi:hypothetical protein
MPYVMVDTNALMRDYPLIAANTQTFLRGCRRCQITVCFPDVVIDELVGNYEKEIRRLTNEHRSVTRKLQRFGIQTETEDFDVQKETESYRTYVHQMMEHHGVTLIPYPEVSPKALVEASYSGRKPFKESGEGFKDFLVFESLRFVAAQQNGEGWFVTGNCKDFCGADGQLHSDLQSALPKTAKVTVFNTIHDFNTHVLSRHLEGLEDIAARIRSGEFDGFNLARVLTDLFIAELCHKYHPIENTGTPLDEPTAVGVGAPETDELTVSRLEEDQLLLELTGKIELTISGFIAKSDLYALSEAEYESVYIDDPDWNDWVVSASTTKGFQFSMTVIFDETKEQPESVSIELEPLEDISDHREPD